MKKYKVGDIVAIKGDKDLHVIERFHYGAQDCFYVTEIDEVMLSENIIKKFPDPKYHVGDLVLTQINAEYGMEQAIITHAFLSDYGTWAYGFKKDNLAALVLQEKDILKKLN